MLRNIKHNAKKKTIERDETKERSDGSCHAGLRSETSQRYGVILSLFTSNEQ